MDDLLVFSSQYKIKCIDFLSDTILILLSNQQLSCFNMASTKYIAQLKHQQQTLPISMELIPEKRLIVVQGKMASNFIYTYDMLGQSINLHFVVKYHSNMHGFCRMLNISNQFFVGINQDAKSIEVYNLLNGHLYAKYLLLEDNICQSVTCLQSTNTTSKQQEKINHNLYLAQQGCKIYKFNLFLQLQQQQENVIQATQSICVQNNKQIKIITSMQSVGQKLYCLIRRSQNLYILQTQPILCTIQVINFKLYMPKNLSPYFGLGDRLSFVLTDQNKVLRIQLGKDNNKISAISQLHQSKSIEYMKSTNKGICGCSEEKQFFYLEI